MTDKVETEIFISINENGKTYYADDAGTAASGLAENYGGACCRTVKLVAKLTPPTIEEVSIDIPDTARTTTEVEAA